MYQAFIEQIHQALMAYLRQKKMDCRPHVGPPSSGNHAASYRPNFQKLLKPSAPGERKRVQEEHIRKAVVQREP